MCLVTFGAVGFNLKNTVCEIITVQQDVVAEFEELVYLNGQRYLPLIAFQLLLQLLFIWEGATTTSSSQIPDATHILATEFPAPDASGA